MQSVCDIVGTIWFRVPTSEVNSDEVKDSFESTLKIPWFNILTWKLLLGDWITFLVKVWFYFEENRMWLLLAVFIFFYKNWTQNNLISRDLTLSYLIIPLYQLTKNSVGMWFSISHYVVGLIQFFFSVTYNER